MFTGMGSNYPRVDEDVKKLQEDLRLAAARARQDISEAANHAAVVAQKKIDELATNARHTGKEVDRFTREHTWSALAVAALVGIALGALFSRGHRD